MQPEVHSPKWTGHPLWLVGFRPFFPLAQYFTLLWVSAGCWSACFLLITARITPLVLQPRIDGKEH